MIKGFFNIICLLIISLSGLNAQTNLNAVDSINQSKLPQNASSIIPCKGIIKTDIFSPFLGAVYFCYQHKPFNKTSIEFGFGLLGSWNKTYITSDYNHGSFFRCGLYLRKGMPQSRYQGLMRGIYLKPEIVLVKQELQKSYDDQVYNQQTGLFYVIQVHDQYHVKGAAFIINIGQCIDFGKLVLDWSVGYGITKKTCLFTSNQPSTKIKVLDDLSAFNQNGYYAFKLNELNSAFQGGVKIGWKIY